MRTLKFRAWDSKMDYAKDHPDGGGWLDGDDIFDTIGLDHCDCFIIALNKHPNIIIEQYTGLKDSEGKEIYEGDIVRFKDQREIKEVIWDIDPSTHEGGFTYKDTFYDWHGMLYPKQCKIIGNIHENPELLNENS